MKSHRLSLGPRFTEGARLTWLALEKRRWTQSDLQRAAGAHPGAITKVMYGDRPPSLKLATRLLELLKIPVQAWQQPPREAFIPPGRRAAEAELAANPLPATGT